MFIHSILKCLRTKSANMKIFNNSIVLLVCLRYEILITFQNREFLSHFLYSAFSFFLSYLRKTSFGELPGAIRFTKMTSRKTSQQTQIEESEQEVDDESENRRITFNHQEQKTTTNLNYQGRKPRRLFLSNKILKNITENRQRFSNYLLNSAYHQVESFDPWRLTEE